MNYLKYYSIVCIAMTYLALLQDRIQSLQEKSASLDKE